VNCSNAVVLCGTPVSSNITEILLKAALNTLSQLLQINVFGQHSKVEVKYKNWQ
jgi:hypothetical protein